MQHETKMHWATRIAIGVAIALITGLSLKYLDRVESHLASISGKLEGLATFRGATESTLHHHETRLLRLENNRSVR